MEGVPGCLAWTPPLFMRARAGGFKQAGQPGCGLDGGRPVHPPRRLRPHEMSSSESQAGRRLILGYHIAPVRPSSEPLPPQILD